MLKFQVKCICFQAGESDIDRASLVTTDFTVSLTNTKPQHFDYLLRNTLTMSKLTNTKVETEVLIPG